VPSGLIFVPISLVHVAILALYGAEVAFTLLSVELACCTLLAAAPRLRRRGDAHVRNLSAREAITAKRPFGR